MCFSKFEQKKKIWGRVTLETNCVWIFCLIYWFHLFQKTLVWAKHIIQHTKASGEVCGWLILFTLSRGRWEVVFDLQISYCISMKGKETLVIFKNGKAKYQCIKKREYVQFLYLSFVRLGWINMLGEICILLHIKLGTINAEYKKKSSRQLAFNNCMYLGV